MCFFKRKQPAPGGMLFTWPHAPAVRIYPPDAHEPDLLRMLAGKQALTIATFALAYVRLATAFPYVLAVSDDIALRFYDAPWTKGAKGVADLASPGVKTVCQATHGMPPTASENLGGATHISMNPLRITVWLNMYILRDPPGYPAVFKATCLHELGHCMGLPHSPVAGEIMNPKTCWAGRVTAYAPRELEQIRQIYGEKA